MFVGWFVWMGLGFLLDSNWIVSVWIALGCLWFMVVNGKAISVCGVGVWIVLGFVGYHLDNSRICGIVFG